jgi:LCP family protein required for cell wall assembly
VAKLANGRKPYRIWAFALIAVAAVALAVLAYQGRFGRNLELAMKTGTALLHLSPGLNRPVNVLLMGTEGVIYTGYHQSYPSFRGNTDTMMLVRFDPRRHRVVVMSIPRDTRVPIPGYYTFKVNEANHLAGPKLSVQTVSQFLGVPIWRYALVNILAVRQIVHDLGGVRVYVPEPMYYTDSASGVYVNFQQGWYHMTGLQAINYLRFRDGRLGDIGRVIRQQEFLKDLVGQLKSPSSWLHLAAVARSLRSNTRTDLTQGEIAKLAVFMASRPKIVRILLPGRFGSRRGVSYWLPDPQRLPGLMVRYFGARSPLVQTVARTASFNPSRIVLGVVSPMHSPGAGQQILPQLQKLGFTHLDLVAANRPAPAHTEVLTNGRPKLAKAVAALLGVQKTEVSPTGVFGVGATLVLGRDWSKVFAQAAN